MPRRATRLPAPGEPHRWRSGGGAAWLRSWRLFSVLRALELHELAVQVEDLLEDEEALVGPAATAAVHEAAHLRLPAGVALGRGQAGRGRRQARGRDAPHGEAAAPQ